MADEPFKVEEIPALLLLLKSEFLAYPWATRMAEALRRLATLEGETELCLETVGPDYVDGVPVPTSLISRIRSLRMAASVEAKEADKYRSLWRSESQARRAEREGVAESFTKLRKERDALAAHAHELEVAIGKPVAGLWEPICGGFARRCLGSTKIAVVLVSQPLTGGNYWLTARPPVESWETDGGICGTGPETGDAGKHAADMSIKDLYHLMGGIHPAPPAPATETP